MRLRSTTLAVCAATLATMALADPKERAPIDLGELRAEAERQFAAADADGNGVVSREEFANVDLQRAMSDPRQRAGGSRRPPEHQPGATPAQRLATAMERRERRAEAQRRQRQNDFGVGDRDGDGQLSAEEYQGLPAARRAHRQDRLFARLDADGDGVLAMGEFPSMATRLATLDANGDDQITPDEMPRRRR